MKKNTIKAFTLVEMLIVIVIIGILIASLMPRMQSAQGRARDVARKNDLAQIQTAIIASQTDRWSWPSLSEATWGMAIQGSGIETELTNAGMSSIPSDPNKANAYTWLWGESIMWAYSYLVATRNGVPQWWFVLMAKTETEGGSNWVQCGTDKDKWYITWWMDLKDIHTCDTLNQSGTTCSVSGGACTYTETAELRYILLY